MHESAVRLAPRKFGRMDAQRGAAILVLLAIVFGLWFMFLPIFQSLILPTAPGGSAGPWVIRPILAFRFCACAILSALCLPIVLAPLQERWSAQDAATRTRYDPFRGKPWKKTGFMIKAAALAVAYTICLLFYLLSWESVGPAGIRQRLPWANRNYSFDQITSLQAIPKGMRSEDLARNGPWFRVTFADGGTFTFSDDNEGLAEDELMAMARFIAAQSGRDWTLHPSARQR